MKIMKGRAPERVLGLFAFWAGEIAGYPTIYMIVCCRRRIRRNPKTYWLVPR